eukprot:gene2238-8538_t
MLQFAELRRLPPHRPAGALPPRPPLGLSYGWRGGGPDAHPDAHGELLQKLCKEGRGHGRPLDRDDCVFVDYSAGRDGAAVAGAAAIPQ